MTLNLGKTARKAALGLALAATTAVSLAAPAEARDRWGRHHDRTGTAIVAGVAGLAIGAALASGSRGDRYYRNDGYYYPRNRVSYYYNSYPSYYYNSYPRGYYYDGYNRYYRDNYRYERKHRRWHRNHDGW